MRFDLKYFPNSSEEATAAIRVETSDPSRLEKLFLNTDGFLEDVGRMADAARHCGEKLATGLYDRSEPGKVVYGFDRFARERNTYLHELDALACALCSCFISDSTDDDSEDDGRRNNHSNKRIREYVHGYKALDGLIVTLSYNSDRFTEIEKIGMITSKLGYGGIRFIASKNGDTPNEYFLLTKTALGNVIFEGGDVMQSPSYGIVQADSKRQYAGSSLCFKQLANNTENDFISYDIASYRDKDGNVVFTESGEVWNGIHKPTVRYAASVAHLFFERDGDDYAFSVLVNGRLHKKISRTNDAVIFHHTPFDFVDLAIDGNSSAGIVFKKENGVYMNAEHTLCSELSISKATNTSITMPTPPKGDNLGASVLHAFYVDCAKALYKTFESSETYFTTKYQWSDEERVYEWSEKTCSHLATDDPPICQVAIKRVDDHIHAFPCGDAEIRVRASVPCGGANDFNGFFAVPFPHFIVDGVAFAESGETIALKPANNVLDVAITDAETQQTYTGKFSLLRMDPDFDSSGIPTNLYLDPNWSAVKNQLDLYRTIKDSIVNYGLKRCVRLFDDSDAKRQERIARTLYGGAELIPDESIISVAVQLTKEYERTHRIPNIALVGQAGTGKSTLAKNLGKLFGKEVLAITPSDLRGAYIGHTKYEVVQRLAEAAEHDKILYLDEAYQLMADSHGHEAVTILLPLMTGERTKVEASLDRGQGDTIELDFGNPKSGRRGRLKITNVKDDRVKKNIELNPGVPPIWFSGYENEIRLMISQNQGLYRRLKKIVIKTPVTSDLLRQFEGELEKLVMAHDETSRKAAMLQKHFNENGKESVRRFFVWGAEPQNSKYFANHAGVSNFVANCIDSIDFSKALGPQIEDIIIATKLDIKRQLATIRSDSGKNPHSHASDTLDTIHVVTDIDTRFSDLVGCDSQISYMQSIIDMLVNKGVYEDSRLTVPKGVLMEGLPGTGKTYIARAMAGELQEHFQREAPNKRFGFMAVSAPELANKPASYIASIFNAAEEYDACILFIDEVDAIAQHRNYNRFYDRYMELIKQMDGIEKRSNVFILAATNAPETLDPAFVRSGRIDKSLVFNLPDKTSREELARRAIRKRLKALANFDPIGKESDIDAVAKLVARRTLRYTASDIENVINNAFVAYRQLAYSIEAGSMIGMEFFKSYPFIRYSQDDRLEVDAAKYNDVSEDKPLNVSADDKM